MAGTHAVSMDYYAYLPRALPYTVSLPGMKILRKITGMVLYKTVLMMWDYKEREESIDLEILPEACR